jgi:wyosine [tRNA(Phe)-imidazoG37] synthetase (radical SAM superfamily)
MRTVYGPIESWRFGRSLGMDPLAQKAKVCPFSCVYCQYGPTAQPSLTRRSYVSCEQFGRDLDSLGPIDCDQITFAGLGEPTLARNLAQLVDVVRQRTTQPIAILTGGALLPRADVRRDLLRFDRVIAKLDAPGEALFNAINRPQRGFPYSWAAVVEGIRRLRQSYTGHLSLQMMFLQSNSHTAPQMAKLARSLQADEVYLDTPLQPALGGPVSASQMEGIARAFSELSPRIIIRNIYQHNQARVKPRLP